MTENTLGMLLAWLDVYHKLVEPLTPKYAEYRMQVTGDASGALLRSLPARVGASVRPPDVAAAHAARGITMQRALVMKKTWAAGSTLVQQAGAQSGHVQAGLLGIDADVAPPSAEPESAERRRCAPIVLWHSARSVLARERRTLSVRDVQR